MPDGISPAEHFVNTIEQHARLHDASFVIIDSITHPTVSSSRREMSKLLAALIRLKNSLGLSILVTAQTRCGTSYDPSLAHLQHFGPLAQFADSVFAIGQTASGPDTYCIKHLRSCTADLSRASARPRCRITKLNGNFPAFESLSNGDDRPTGPDWPLIDEIKKLSDNGLSLRQIAAKLNISKTTAHRLLQQWMPEPSALSPRFSGLSGSEPPAVAGGSTQLVNNETAHRGGNATVMERAATQLIDTSESATQRESPPEGGTPNAPDTRIHQEEYHGQHTDWYLESIGMKPVWREKASGGVRESGGEEEKTTPDPPPLTSHHSPLTIKKDGYGREIHVESEDPTGRPMIWYLINPDGTIYRFERSLSGILCTVVDALPEKPPPNDRDP